MLAGFKSGAVLAAIIPAGRQVKDAEAGSKAEGRSLPIWRAAADGRRGRPGELLGGGRRGDAVRVERGAQLTGAETGGQGSHPAVCCQEHGGRVGAPVAPKLGFDDTRAADREACGETRERE